MRIDINHPTFLNFVDNVIGNITTNLYTERYFNLSPDQKINEQLKAFKLMNSSLRSGVKLNELEFKSFLTVLWKKSEDLEKYELSAILKDIINNFDTVYEVMKPIKKVTRKIKTDVNNKNE